jgi:two-component sensor histidine kinase
MTGICEDITAHKRAEAELALRARQQEALAQLGEQALAGNELRELFGVTVETVAGMLSADFAEILEISQDRDMLEPRAAFGWDEPVAGQAADSSEADTFVGFALRSDAPVVLADAHGETRFSLSARAAASGITSGAAVKIGGGNGRPFGVLAVYCLRPRCISRTDVRFLQSVANVLGSAVRGARDQERRDLLIGELRHRVGNLFSLVQALHRQTGLSALDARDLEMKFGARLAALAGAHTLILDGGWQRTSLRALLQATLAPYLDRVGFSGIDVQLPAEAAFSFSMALHELATNANKYGALSSPDGRLDIIIGTAPDPLGRRITLVWKERDGPPPPEAANEGFGSRLIAQVVERQLGGKVVREVEPGGLRFTIELPVA